jgi:hypothetical protein
VYVVFDLLAHRGDDLRGTPFRKRRRRLEKLLARGLAPELVLTPTTTTDPTVAATWRYGFTSSGIEGVVAKRADQPYRPGVRGWRKLRTRLTAEAVIGGVLGPLHAPHALIVGRYDDTGRLVIAGRTLDLHPAAQATVAAVLQPPPRAGHPWPVTLPRSHYGRPASAQPYTRVRPDAVAELVVDPAIDGLRWRHATRFLRLRPDLRPTDLHPTHLKSARAVVG